MVLILKFFILTDYSRLSSHTTTNALKNHQQQHRKHATMHMRLSVAQAATTMTNLRLAPESSVWLRLSQACSWLIIAYICESTFKECFCAKRLANVLTLKLIDLQRTLAQDSLSTSVIFCKKTAWCGWCCVWHKQLPTLADYYARRKQARALKA